MTFRNTVGDVRTILRNRDHAGSVFQVASQFNCLEMVGPGVTPDHGISIYARDRTQGPACAMSCPAATAYRNYFAGPAKSQGQGGDKGRQIDCLARVAKVLDNATHKYWYMKNGYALPLSLNSMNALGSRLKSDQKLREEALEALEIGVNWDTEVWHREKNLKVEGKIYFPRSNLSSFSLFPFCCSTQGFETS